MDVYALGNKLVWIFSVPHARSHFVLSAFSVSVHHLHHSQISNHHHVSIFQAGCSLRMLNPQAFSSTVWNVLSILQEQFGSMAGANVWVFTSAVILEILFSFFLFFFSYYEMCVLLLNQIPDTARNTRLRSSLWRHRGVCGSAGGEETLESVQPKVRWREEP